MQATTVQLALTLVRDEILWMVKHSNVPTPKAKHKPNPEDYTDSTLPELLFLAVQLKGSAEWGIRFEGLKTLKFKSPRSNFHCVEALF